MGPGRKKGSNWTDPLPRLDPRMWPLRGNADLRHPSLTFVKRVHLNLHHLEQPDTSTERTQDKTRAERDGWKICLCVCVVVVRGRGCICGEGGGTADEGGGSSVRSTLYIHFRKPAERTAGTLTSGAYLHVEMRAARPILIPAGHFSPPQSPMRRWSVWPRWGSSVERTACTKKPPKVADFNSQLCVGSLGGPSLWKFL